MVTNERQKDEIIDSLRSCHLFNKLNNKQIAEIAPAFRIKSYEPDQAIFNQGDFVEDIYIIKEGQVSLKRLVNMGEHTAEIVTSLLGRCRMLGCWACILDEGCTITESAICQKPTKVIAAPGADLRKRMEADSHIAITVLKSLCHMLGDKISDVYSAMGTF